MLLSFIHYHMLYLQFVTILNTRLHSTWYIYIKGLYLFIYYSIYEYYAWRLNLNFIYLVLPAFYDNYSTVDIKTDLTF